MKVHRYTYPRTGRVVHHVRVRIPRWLYAWLLKHGAKRCPLEQVTERGAAHKLDGAYKKFDYWA